MDGRGMDSELEKVLARETRWLIVLGFIGMILVVWGLYQLHLWISLLGAVVLILAQLWRIDRFSTLYELYEDKGHQ
jgi:heme A synthase